MKEEKPTKKQEEEFDSFAFCRNMGMKLQHSITDIVIESINGLVFPDAIEKIRRLNNTVEGYIKACKIREDDAREIRSQYRKIANIIKKSKVRDTVVPLDSTEVVPELINLLSIASSSVYALDVWEKIFEIDKITNLD